MALSPYRVTVTDEPTLVVDVGKLRNNAEGAPTLLFQSDLLTPCYIGGPDVTSNVGTTFKAQAYWTPTFSSYDDIYMVCAEGESVIVHVLPLGWN